jgi:archaellum component FlaC
MTKADKTVAFRPSLEVWENLQQESNYSEAIEKALKQYYGIEGVTAGQTPQSPIAPLMERLELLEEKLKISTLEARRSASENEDEIIDLTERVYDLEAANKKLVTRLNNMPSQESQEEVINVNQVSEAIEGATDPVSGIEAERLAPIGIEAKELKDILEIPQSTLSDWVKRKEDGKGKPSRGSHKDKWSEFMMWEKSEGKWYRY